ncbi:L-dopachrome tautomerase-related protein [Salinisphaera sp. Q1T1-3]|uniref:L-dopachrome tautomerase-related protein n=1 Tax=Salinisphaera sp. Q1T1-3 TaxID=2321229 RepID=UPI000E70DF8D|nr:L-dopachrome tautomerase-related protein [Salinisphaera sp. Q1T1-3]RJS94130.1 hypothetical protein D3260_06100 [Salinisphaera sp. Q1T1-3]
MSQKQFLMRETIQYAAVAIVLAGLSMPLWAAPAAKEATDADVAGALAAPEKTNGADAALDPVARFGNDFKLVGIAVTPDGHLFASAPASADARSSASVVTVDPETGATSPFPNAAWNHYDAQAAGRQQWISVQALWVDRANRLWALDKSLPDAPDNQPPKLVALDPATGRITHRYTFGNVLEPGDSLNDVRVDDKHNVAYISNAKNGGGILVVDLASGRSRMVLRRDRSSVADPDQHLKFGDRIARTQDGHELSLDTDGLALSPDRDWLYYRPLSDRHYYRIPTAALIDRSLTPAQRAAKVEPLGDHALSGGLAMSDAGVLYAGDLEHHSVVALTPTRDDKGRPQLESQVLVHDPERLAWADGFAIANGYLYIADSHLNETHFANGYPRRGDFTIFRVPLLNGPGGAPDPD